MTGDLRYQFEVVSSARLHLRTAKNSEATVVLQEDGILSRVHSQEALKDMD